MNPHLSAGIRFSRRLRPTADPVEVISLIRKTDLLPGPFGADLLRPMKLFVQVPLIDEIFLGFAVEFFDERGVPPLLTVGKYI